MTSPETLTPDADPKDPSPLERIENDIFSVISAEPHNKTDNTLIYVNEMGAEQFSNGGVWSLSLRQAIEAGKVSYEARELELEEMNERQQSLATDPVKPEIFYRHTITLI